MKYLRFSLIAVMTMMVALLQAQTNVLRVDRVETPAGKTVTLPIVLENSSDITGVQFDITVPYELSVDDNQAVMVSLSKTRAAGHIVTTKKLSSVYDYSYYSITGSSYPPKYRVIVYSSDNSLLLDDSGTLLTLQIAVPGDLNDGTVLPVKLTDVTLSDTHMNNVLTAADNGDITIKEVPRPDLEPTDITFTETSVSPGGTLHVAWKVKNVGKVSTEGGWSEEISLVNLSGTVSKLLATTRFSDLLANGSEVSRQAELTLPALLGIDGVAKVQVTIIPNDDTGEHPSLRDNNTAKSDNNLTVGRQLVIEASPQSVSEAQTWQRITCKLSRSGDWTNLQSFTISKTNDNGTPSKDTRLTVPEIVTINAGQSGTVFYISVSNNDVLDADSVINLTFTPVSANYEPTTTRIVIEDDELPSLTLTPSKNELTEGTDNSFNLTVETERAPKEALVVTLTSENSKRFSFPSAVIIPAGQTTAQATVTVVNDDTPNGTLTNQFTASAPRHNKGTALVVLNDDDLPVLQLSLTPTQVQESDGPVSVVGVLKRTSNIDKKVTIKLTDDADGGLYFGNRTLEMPRGTQEIHFNFGPVDNQDKEGDRTYTITAAVWMSSCSCDASGEEAGHISATLQVLDDDGKALRLSSSAATVKEGGTMTLTVTRNTSDNSEPVTVNITSDYDDQLEYEHTVTIPAGEKTQEVEVTSKLNAVSGDSHTVIFTVAADDHASGTCWVLITDQTLPDAVVKDISVTPTELLVGDAVTMTLQIGNEGNSAVLPAATQVKVYEKGTTNALATFTIDDDLPVGEVRTLEKRVTPTKNVGTHQLYAVINEDNTVQELSNINNTSATVDVEVASPFMATLSTDKERYNQNDVVVFTGQLSGRDTEDAEVDLYIVCDGTRQEQRVRVNAQGAFTYKWELGATFSGHAIAGVCYPGAKAKDELTSFDIYGLRRYDTSYIKHQLTVGETTESIIQLVNPGVLTLTGLKVEVTEKSESYDIEASIPSTIEGGVNDAQLTYKLTANAQSTGNQWEPVKLLITSNEGIELPLTLYCYARMAQANLVCPNQRITTTMTKGQVREYPVTLINNGQGNTGKVSLALPDWISCAQGSTLAGINKGDTVTIVLRLKPTDDMQLNVPVSGTIGFNVEYGNGTYANFSITPVSDQTGTLKVVVADEYTYYTDEKPHVKDAQVVLRNSVTNAIVTIGGQPAQGLSDENGIVTFENLPEGYYKLSVTADKHDSYANNIIVDPGVTTTKVVNLSVETIKVSWSVEETEVEDVYDIVTTVTYETNVPAPVVDLIVPTRIPADSLAEGESLVFYAIATNKGLINALNTEITLPERTGIYLWEPLVENTGLTLAPQQSYIVPVRVTRLTPSDSRMRRANSSSGCVDKMGVDYEWECGYDRKWHQVEKPIKYKECPASAMNGGGGGGGGGGGLGNPAGSGWGGYGGYSSGEMVTITNECDPCAMSILTFIGNCAVGFTPAGCGVGLTECVLGFKLGFSEIFDCVLAAGGCLANATVGKIIAVIACFKGLWNPVETCWKTSMAGGRRMAPAKILDTDPTTIAYINEFLRAAYLTQKQWEAAFDVISEAMGDTLWLESTGAELEQLLEVVSITPNEKLIADDLRYLKPEGVTNEVFDRFIKRVINTRRYDSDGTEPADGNRIHIEAIEAAKASSEEANQWAMDHRGMTAVEYFNDAYATLQERMKEPRNSVCSTITLQIKQTMTLTRQAFRGTLTVFNGNETVAMENMKLNLVVSDMNNNVATAHEFQINAESLKGMEGPLTLDGGWTLAPNSEGTATILFIPTKYAAPTEPVEWSFGGTLSYTDPYTGLEVTRELYPVTLTVKPSPELDLTYFMQRDLYGDDALTPDIIEPIEPGEFALLISNKGYGDATNVKMVTQQPEIIEIEKGLAIDFEIVSSQVNGGPAALSFGQTIANDLGNIPAHSQAYAQWWLQSTLLGHFTSYKVEATHVTSYDNPDLSLLDQVTIHELIHGFTPPSSSTQRAFLCNDIEDANDLPDQVYFTNATQQDVYIAKSASAVKQSKTEYLLTVIAGQAGWNYANLLDPTAGKQQLLKVVRQSDGQELPLDNCWQTNRTLRDGQEWLYDHRLHIVGEMAAAGETYVLTYEERPDTELDFALSGPVYEEDYEKEGLVIADVDEVKVAFNKPINAATFDADDVTFQVQGERQDLTQMTITPKDGEANTYVLNLAELNKTLPNGYYVLTVQGAGISDNEGYQGLYGRKIDWVLFRGGLVDFRTTPMPANGGSIEWTMLNSPNTTRRQAPTADTDKANYGNTVLLTATANTGFAFVNWTLDGNVVSTEPEFQTVINADANYVANFKKLEYKVDVAVSGEGGTLAGNGTGYYEYETELNIVAKPDADYILKQWVVDGVQVAPCDTLTLAVTKATKVEALFVRDIFLMTLSMPKGWSWISSYINEPVALGDMSQYASRILSQTDELLRDPQFGLVGGIDAIMPGQAYKVQTDTRFLRSLRGHLAAGSIDLEKGWNWIAYPYYESRTLDVLTNTENGDYITSLTGGFSSYEDGSWEGTLLSLTPGEGYLYKSASGKQLRFTFDSAAGSRSYGTNRVNVTNVTHEDVVDPHSYPSTMNITARIYRDGSELNGQQYTIYAFAGQELRGISQFIGQNHYLTVYGDDPVDITFIVEESETGDKYEAKPSITFRSDVVGSRSQPYVLNLGSTIGINQLSSDSPRMTVYTLEGILVSRDATLKTLYRLPKGVYIVNGQKCYIK